MYASSPYRSFLFIQVLFEHSLSKLEENFDVLMSLLTHEYCELRKPQIIEVSEGIREIKGSGGVEVNRFREELKLLKISNAREEEQKSSITPVLPFQSDSHSYENLFNKILHQISKLAIKKP